jgi:hypothetical protein
MAVQKIKLGDEIEDVTSGLHGIAIGVADYLSGARHWILQPPLDSSGSPQRDQYIPDAYVRRVGDGVYVAPKQELGFKAREPKK